MAVLEFLKRPHWSRLWIIQEIVSGSPEVIVLCGSRQIDWKKLCYDIGTLRKHIFVVKNSLLQHDRSRLRIENTTAWETPNLHRIRSDLWVLSVNAEQGRQDFEFPPAPFSGSPQCIPPSRNIQLFLGD